jgi:acyl carrier protein
MGKAVSTDGSIEQVAEIVAALLARKGLPPVGLDANLWESGLASMDIVNLMLEVEEAFDIQLPEAQMTPENFRTVRAIEALIAGLD